MSFAKNMDKNVSNKYGQNLVNNAKKCTADAIKTTSIKAFQKTAEATDYLIGNKIAEKITSVSRKSPKKSHSQNEDEIEVPKKGYISPEKIHKIIDELRLV